MCVSIFIFIFHFTFWRGGSHQGAQKEWKSSIVWDLSWYTVFNALIIIPCEVDYEHLEFSYRYIIVFVANFENKLLVTTLDENQEQGRSKHRMMLQSSKIKSLHITYVYIEFHPSIRFIPKFIHPIIASSNRHSCKLSTTIAFPCITFHVTIVNSRLGRRLGEKVHQSLLGPPILMVEHDMRFWDWRFDQRWTQKKIQKQ